LVFTADVARIRYQQRNKTYNELKCQQCHVDSLVTSYRTKYNFVVFSVFKWYFLCTI